MFSINDISVVFRADDEVAGIRSSLSDSAGPCGVHIIGPCHLYRPRSAGPGMQRDGWPGLPQIYVPQHIRQFAQLAVDLLRFESGLSGLLAEENSDALVARLQDIFKVGAELTFRLASEYRDTGMDITMVNRGGVLPRTQGCLFRWVATQTSVVREF